MSSNKALYDWYIEGRKERLEYIELLSKHDLGDVFGDKLRPWNLLYELPETYFLSVFASISGIESNLKSIESVEDFIALLPRAMENLDLALSEIDPDANEEEVVFLLMGLHALMFNQIAIEQWGISINEAISVISSNNTGSDELLLKAIYTDRTVIGCLSVQRYLATKQLASDENFFANLAKSLTKTKPKRKERAYEPMRYMFKVLLELNNSDKVTPKEAIRMCDELALYTEGKDPISAISKYVERFNKQRKDIK